MKSLLAVLGHQNWLRFGIRDRIIRFFHNPDSKQDEPFETHFFGKVYPGNFNNFLDWSVYYYGAYTKDELICMRDFLDGLETPVVIDIGANVGHHTLFASTVANHVHAFEPFPPVRAKLEEKIRANSLSNVTIHELGLGNENDTMLFSPPKDNNMGTGSFRHEGSKSGTMPLTIRRGDDYFESAGINKIDYIKMDVEGFEIEALKGMKNTLTKHRPVIFFEWTQEDSKNSTSSATELFPSGYSFYKFGLNRPFLVFFNSANYHLRKLGSKWDDGNILAIPAETIERIQSEKPSSRLAQVILAAKT